MPMYTSPSIDKDSDRTATILPRMGPITTSLSPATQNDILGILQREQDHAMALLSSSPLLSSLFVSYANRAAALESASSTPSPESEEWKILQTTIAELREENGELKSESLEVTGKLEAAVASQEAFRSQVLSLKEINTTQQDDIKSLRAEFTEVEDEHNRLTVDSNTENAALKVQVLDLEARREELKEAVVEQQIRISKLERQASIGLAGPPEAVTPIETPDLCKLDNPEERNTANASTRITRTEERAEREAKEWTQELVLEKASRRKAEREAAEKVEQEVKEKAEREGRERAEEARVKAEKSAKRKAEKEAEEQAEREAKAKAEQEAREKAEKGVRKKAEREAKEMAEREERLEREEVERVERVRKEAMERAEREGKEGEEKKKVPAGKVPSAWGSTVGKNDRSRKTSSLPRKEQKNEWANTWDLNSIDREKEDHSGLPPITTSTVSGLFDGAGHSDFSSGKRELPGGAEELELRTPLAKDVGKLEMLEDLNMNNVSARVPVSSRSENEHWSDADQGLSPNEPTPPALAPKIGAGTSLSITPELLRAPNEVKGEAPATPRSLPAPSLTPAHKSQVPVPVPVPAKTEPERPLSLWERKKPEVARPPVHASGGDGMNSSGVLGDAPCGGGKVESIAMPTFVGDRRSIFTDTARDQRRESQREDAVEGFLGSSSARRRNDPAQSRMTTRPTLKSPTAPAPAPQKASGWGSWGTSLLNVASTIHPPDGSPSPEPHPVKPKTEDPPRGFTRSRPPMSQPAAIAEKKEAGGTQDCGWGWEEATGTKGSNKTSKDPSPVRENVLESESPREMTKEPAKMEETVTPAEEEFDWANTKKKGRLASIANAPSVPNTPDPDNADDGPSGGTGGGKKKRKGKK